MSSIAFLSYAAEPFLMAIAMFALLRSKEYRRFPALFAYFTLRLGSSVVLCSLIQMSKLMPIGGKTAYIWYFYTYWITYVAGAIAIFLVVQEMFKFAMEPLPGLKRLGMIAFRWVAGISLIAASAALLTPGGRGYKLLLAVVAQVMRCESIFILSLLLFLMLAAGKLGLSYRSRVFGVSFGFGIMAATDLLNSATFLHFGRNMLTSSVTAVTTGASLLTLVVWSAYFMQKEPVRMPATFALASPLVRWNEIAMEIGLGGRGAARVPANDFFITDVENVVDRILTKNSLKVAS